MNRKRAQQIQKLKLKLIAAGILIILCIGIFQIIRYYKSDFNIKDTVTMEEVSNLMSFTVFSAGEWISYLEGDEILTYGSVNKIFSALSDDREPYEEKKERKAVPKEEWFKIYEEILDKYDTEGKITKEEFLVLATADTTQGLEKNEVYTDRGIICTENTGMNTYLNQSVYAFCKEGAIISIKEILEKEVKLQNVWFADSDENGFTIFVDNLYIALQQGSLKEPLKDVLGDITFYEGQIKAVQKKEEKISGKLLAIKNEGIEIESYGLVPYEENFRVFKNYSELSQGKKKDLVVGYNLTEFVVAQGRLCGAVINRTLQMENIRVLLQSSNYQGLYQEEVVLTSDTNFHINYGDKKEMHAAGEEIVLNPESVYFEEHRVNVIPDIISGKIIIRSLKRNRNSSVYRGTLELTSEEEGILMVNELPLEEYLYAVVPSEMPESYGLEALKAQAVCARSYAYNQVLNNAYAAYGAHVDDSTKFQVYGNLDENSTATQAVKETFGQVAVCGESVIDAYYFSTSCGHTSNEEVWGADQTEHPYLTGHTLNEEKAVLNLEDEHSMREFLRNKEYTAYDSDISWYRWETTISTTQIEDNIQNSLRKRYEINPEHILVRNSSGEYVSTPVSSVGKVKSISIVKRNTGGIAEEMLIEGEDCTVKVITEYNIRAILAPLGSKLMRKDGSLVDGSSLLPSAYCILEPVIEKNKLKAVKILGGGYGHGVGMSQNGAKGMAGAGKNYQEILNFFYEGIQIKNMNK